MKSSNHDDKFIDLRGKKCPLNFVYTKLALEELKQGQILKVALDYPPAFTNVPRSVNLQELGEVLDESESETGEKTIWIKKIQRNQ